LDGERIDVGGIIVRKGGGLEYDENIGVLDVAFSAKEPAFTEYYLPITPAKAGTNGGPGTPANPRYYAGSLIYYLPDYAKRIYNTNVELATTLYFAGQKLLKRVSGDKPGANATGQYYFDIEQQVIYLFLDEPSSNEVNA
jgi:hypothetical protein